jgi:serine/threonine protein phosphatase PrpC
LKFSVLGGNSAVDCAAVYQTPHHALRIEYAEVSLLGCRNDNQDRVSVAVSEHSALLVVIDGMGGHSDGAKAAETAIKVLVEAFWHTPQPILDPIGFLHLCAWFRTAAHSGRTSATAASICCVGARC